MAKINPTGSGTIPLVPLLITESNEDSTASGRHFMKRQSRSGSSRKCTSKKSPTSSGRSCG